MSEFIKYRCPACGAPGLVPADFRPVHFTGSLSHLSRGYCTVNCARVELNRIIVERTKAWHLSAVLEERL
jgi:endogenous inhibitor of DNA gyrase (YacG/DUF329 family)